MSAIEFKGVSKGYGERSVIEKLSFRIETGERVVVHGPSGRGKTTVLRLLAGFIPPNKGEIRIGEQLVSSGGKVLVGPERRQVGMVFQDLALWPQLTVAENLEFALKAQGIEQGMRKERITTMLAKVQLAEYAEVYPGRLSGGQQQRVAIARALVARPLALLMDEPLANLDEELRSELSRVILDLHAQLTFTLVYVTHSKEETRNIGTRTILLQS